MLFALALFILYAIPISIGILALHWVLKKMGRARLATLFRKYLFILLAVGFVAANIVNWKLTHHSMSFTYDDRYKIEVLANEIESFLDWPIEFDVEIVDLKTGACYDFEFESDGPYYQILISGENVIWLNGYGRGSGQNWTLDLDNSHIMSGIPHNDRNFELVAEITPDFKIIKK